MEIEMRTLLPKFLTHDRNGWAVCKGIEKGMQMYTDAVETGRKLISEVDSMPEWRLDEMAWELNCIYDPALPIADKRKMIRNAIEYSRRAGTYRCLTSVLSILNDSLEATAWADATYIGSGTNRACIINVYIGSDDDAVKSRVFTAVKNGIQSIIPLNCGIQLATFETDLTRKWVGRYDLTQFDVSPWSYVTLTGISQAFQRCRNLETVNLTGLKTQNLTNISWLFYQCYALKEADISTWDTSSVTNMSVMFDECESIKKISMDGCDVSSVTNFNGTFIGCTELETFLPPSGKSAATNLTGIFAKDTALETLALGGICPSEEASCSGANAFYDCTNLKTLDVSNWNWSKLTGLKNTFRGCSNLTEIVFAETPGTISPQEIDLSAVKFTQETMGTFCGMLETSTDGSGILDVWVWTWGDTLKALVTGKGWTIKEGTPQVGSITDVEIDGRIINIVSTDKAHTECLSDDGNGDILITESSDGYVYATTLSYNGYYMTIES